MMTQRNSVYLTRSLLAGGLLAMLTCGFGRGQQAVIAPQGANLPTKNSPANVSADEDKRTAKQKLLDGQAQRLATVAAELKVEVDKTNKNILSLHVVRKAEEIEALARTMKDQNKR